MKKRFKGKRNLKKKSKKLLTFILLVLFFFGFSFHMMSKYWFKNISTENLFEALFQNAMGTNKIFDFLKMNPTEFLFSSTMGVEIPKSESAFLEEEESGPVYEYVPDPSPTLKNQNPIIYIFNTHQTEGYSKNGMSEYDIVPTVLFASYYLREKLNTYNLPTLVETNDISEILRVNSWSYSHSYEASRYLVLSAKEKNPNLTYFLDIHRDSANYDTTTTEYMGKKYARILFVIGKEHENYEKNLQLATTLNEKIKLKINTLSRGVIGKEGKNVNGIYNQDIHPNLLLLEIGGKDNSLEEVTNTMELLATVLKEYIGEIS